LQLYPHGGLVAAGAIRFNREATQNNDGLVVPNSGGFMKRATWVPLIGAITVVGVFSAVVSAQTARPDRAIKYRQGIMNAQGWNLGILGAMAKGDRPYNKDEAVRSATFVNQLLQMSWDAFAPGTDTGAPTKAKPEIWKEPAKFKQLAEAAQAESLKLVAAAQAGDLAALRPAVGAMGKSCNNCHDDFQSK